MALKTSLELNGLSISQAEARRVEHQLEGLGRRLTHHPEPSALVVLTAHPAQRRVEASLRVQLGPLGAHLVSHQSAETAEHAVRLAVEDVERQLERRLARQRGEPTYGVPSRREPTRLRPARLPAREAETPDSEAQ